MHRPCNNLGGGHTYGLEPLLPSFKPFEVYPNPCGHPLHLMPDAMR
jgi:hypothetical protein